jgi:serine/threonine-protein kinase
MSEPENPEAEPKDDPSALTTIWREQGVSVSGLDVETSASLAASDRALTSGLTRSTGGLRLDEATRRTLAHETVVVGAELGRGGMGVVSAAEQKTLRREVAVKRLAEWADDAALASLLKEAWVGGLLAHPNVAPVHALVELDGAPAVVMKRITGTSWRETIRDPSRVPDADRDDRLGFHLRVLVSVCNAVAYAHEHGVLHLDLKPENVMLGRFGEVSVLDWGLAAGWGGQAPAWLPRAVEIRSVSGTPDYMAPEVATATGPKISPRTDVYLLGACLHEAVTGRAPHRGGSAMQRLVRAFRSDPQRYGDDVPPELVAILHRAMHRDPEARYATAGALRDAIEGFLAHREGLARVRELHVRVTQLEAAVRGDVDDESVDELAVARAFGAARFSLREAEAALPAHADLPGLKERLYAAMARSALALGRIALAEKYLAELARPPEALRDQLEKLRSDEAARTARVKALERIAHAEDLDAGASLRRRVLLGSAALILVGHLAYWALEGAGVLVLDYGTMIPHTLLVGVGIGVYSWIKRAAFFQNHANGALYSIALISYVAFASFWLASLALGLPFRTAQIVSATAYLLPGGAVTTLVSARFWPAAVCGGLMMLAASLAPEHVWPILGLGASSALAAVALAWRDAAPTAAPSAGAKTR